MPPQGHGFAEAVGVIVVPAKPGPTMRDRVVQEVRRVGHRLREVLPYDAVDLRERFAGVRPASQRVDSVRHLVFGVAVPRYVVVGAVRHQAMDRRRHAARNKMELGEPRVGEPNLQRDRVQARRYKFQPPTCCRFQPSLGSDKHAVGI